MITGFLWLLHKAITDYSSPDVEQSSIPFLTSLEPCSTEPPLTNFYNVGTFCHVDTNTFFFGKFHASVNAPDGGLIQSAKWFTIKGDSPIRLEALFKFWGEIYENYFYPFEKAVQVIPYHGRSLLMTERKENKYFVSLFKVRSNGLKRIRMIYEAKNLSEMTATCLRPIYVKKGNKVVISGLDRWIIYDLTMQYTVYQHFTPTDMACDVVYSETLNLLFVCYLRSIVVYEWNSPFDVSKVAYKIEPERDQTPAIFMSLFLKDDCLILRDNTRVTAWRVYKEDFQEIASLDTETLLALPGDLDSEVMVIPEKNCIVIIDSSGSLYEVGFENSKAFKYENRGFRALVAYNDKTNELAVHYDKKLVFLRPKKDDDTCDKQIEQIKE